MVASIFSTQQPAFRGGIPAPWTPMALGDKLLAFYDAEDAGTIVQSSGLVSSWTDKKTGVALTQGAMNQQPVYQPNGLNGRPTVFFDGTDDALTKPGVGILPLALANNEIWGLADSLTAEASSIVRLMFHWGAIGGANPGRRSAERRQAAGSSRFSGTVGNGVAAVTPVPPPFSGVHTFRNFVDATTSTSVLDGTASASVAASGPAVNPVATALGAGHTETGPSNFFWGSINNIVVTTLLTADEAAQLLAWQKARGGIV